MKHLFWLKGDHLDLARAEAIALTSGKCTEIVDDVLLIDSEHATWSRFGLTRTVGKYLFISNTNKLIEAINKFDWNEECEKDFKVVLHHSNEDPKKIANLVWKKLGKPKVNLKNPKTIFDFFFVDDKVFASKRLWTNEEDFESRRSHLLPAPHPSGMHPKLARVIINLTGIPDHGEIVDPFCGAGGFLLEAKRMGLNAQGSDNDAKQVERAKKNLGKLGGNVQKKDALTLANPIDYLSTDLPYGRNTKAIDKQRLYKDFLKLLGKLLKKYAVIVFPDFADVQKLVKGTGLSIKAKYPIFVHKSLTRKIIVLEPHFSDASARTIVNPFTISA